MLSLLYSLCLKVSEATRRTDPLDHAAAQLVIACHVLTHLPAAAMTAGYFPFLFL